MNCRYREPEQPLSGDGETVAGMHDLFRSPFSQSYICSRYRILCAAEAYGHVGLQIVRRMSWKVNSAESPRAYCVITDWCSSMSPLMAASMSIDAGRGGGMDEMWLKQGGPDDAPDFIGITGKRIWGVIARFIDALFRQRGYNISLTVAPTGNRRCRA